MGLDTTHDCWHGAYSSFNVWRDKVAEVAGYEMKIIDGKSAPVIDWDSITEDNIYGEWERAPEDPLLILIAHSDCDGKIKAEFTKPLADRLTPLVQLMPDGEGPGHIGYWRKKTQQFIDGLLDAHSNDEDVEFY